LRDILEAGQFTVVDVVPCALGKAEQEHRSALGPIGDQHAIAARLPLSRSRNPLLDDAAPQIGIDRTSFGPAHGLAEAPVRNPLAPCKTGEGLGLEYPQTHELPCTVL